MRKNAISRVFSGFLSLPGALHRITSQSREISLNMVATSFGDHYQKDAGEVKIDTKSFLHWWFSNNIPVRTSSSTSKVSAPRPQDREKEVPFTYEVVGTSDLEPLETSTFAMKSDVSDDKAITSTANYLSSSSSSKSGVAGFMDYDPKTAASKQHRGRQSWLKL